MTMCHQTLTWFSSETRLMPPMFMASWTSIRMPIVTSCPFSTFGMNSVVLNVMLKILSMIVALMKPAAA